jgi:hypothetical protein
MHGRQQDQIPKRLPEYVDRLQQSGRYTFTGDDAVQLQQLGDKGPQFVNQSIRGIGLSNKAGNIRALGHPDTSLAVPLRPYFVNARWCNVPHREILSGPDITTFWVKTGPFSYDMGP